MANQKLAAGRRIFESTGFGRCLSRKTGYPAGGLLPLELATVLCRTANRTTKMRTDEELRSCSWRNRVSGKAQGNEEKYGRGC